MRKDLATELLSQGYRLIISYSPNEKIDTIAQALLSDLLGMRRLPRVVLRTAGFAATTCLTSLSLADADDEKKAGPSVLGLGTAGVDYVAMLDAYPSPDDKVRVQRAFQGGGGNVANTLTTLARLGVTAQLFTKIGNDEHGKTVMRELESDGVDTSHVLCSAGTSTAFTYVIVDAATKTRTCIHTPQQQELTREDVVTNCRAILEEGQPSLVHLDSRHTEAALTLARLANKMDIPVSIDAEKNRPPFFQELLPLCDLIFTNERFPHLYSGADITKLFDNSRANIIVTSLGDKGSILYVRHRRPTQDTTPITASLEQRLHAVAISATDKLPVRTQLGKDYDVFSCPAWALNSEQVVDTTGAGDAFIGGFIAAYVHKRPLEQCLQIGTLCAAHKIQQPGTRLGLPTVDQLETSVDIKHR